MTAYTNAFQGEALAVLNGPVLVRRLWPGHVPLEWYLAKVVPGPKNQVVGRAKWTNNINEAWAMTQEQAFDFLRTWAKYGTARGVDPAESCSMNIIPATEPAEG